MIRPTSRETPESFVPSGPDVGSPPDATDGPAIVNGMGVVDVEVCPGAVPWRTPAPLLSSTRTAPVPASVENLTVFSPVCQSRGAAGLDSPNCPPFHLTTAGAAV